MADVYSRVRMIPGVKRVTVLQTTGKGARVTSIRPLNKIDLEDGFKFSIIAENGRVRHGLAEERLGERKSTSKSLRPVDRRLRKLLRIEQKAIGNYLVLHDRSSRKNKNGWAKDFGRNLVKAIRRS